MKITVYHYPARVIPERTETVIVPESWGEAQRLRAMTDEEKLELVQKRIEEKGVVVVTG